MTLWDTCCSAVDNKGYYKLLGTQTWRVSLADDAQTGYQYFFHDFLFAVLKLWVPCICIDSCLLTNKGTKFYVNTFLLPVTLLHVSMNKHHHYQGISLYFEVTKSIEVNLTVIYKCHNLLSLLYINVKSYWVCYIQKLQVTKSVVYKCHKLLSMLYTNVTSY
jgi:hypothetical protein